MPYAYALCPMPYALCPMPYALCRIVPHMRARKAILLSLGLITVHIENTELFEQDSLN